MLVTLWDNPVLFAAVLGSLFLLWWWGRYSQTFSGFKATFVGCAIILLLGFTWNKIPAFPDLAHHFSIAALPFAFAVVLLVLLAVMLIAVVNRRHAAIDRGMRDLPLRREEKCPHCGQRGYLHSYEVQVGRRLMIQRMCSDCAAQRDGQLSSI